SSKRDKIAARQIDPARKLHSAGPASSHSGRAGCRLEATSFSKTATLTGSSSTATPTASAPPRKAGWGSTTASR
ncbi:MAG: hypothetical protein LUO89_10275, partial [Methanothrix sp.]|nr:hypothetical protein [Methanothrix sp.]